MITSASNPRLRLVRRLSSRNQRDRLGLFVCEGEDLVQAARAAGIEPVELLVDAERPVEGLEEAEAVEPRLLAEVSALGHPPRAIGIFRRDDLPRLDSPSPPPVGLALWHVADPGNIGTLVRAADGLGPAFVALSEHCADPTGPKALRASAGAIFRVPTAHFDDAPGRRVALVAHGGKPLHEVDRAGAILWVLGAEREGLPTQIEAACDEIATITLENGAESLNVAMAGSIALYEWRRQARASSDPPR
jgi:RNA methyltransferase, TrmH family